MDETKIPGCFGKAQDTIRNLLLEPVLKGGDDEWPTLEVARVYRKCASILRESGTDEAEGLATALEEEVLGLLVERTMSAEDVAHRAADKIREIREIVLEIG
jgi:hypothetical protein